VAAAAESTEPLKLPISSTTIVMLALRWSPQHALQFLKDAPVLIASVVVRLPARWRMNRPARPRSRRRSATGRPLRWASMRS
jgi:hypothetical protein